MGFIQKKDEDKGLVDSVEVIGRGEGPDGLEEPQIELHEGSTAEDISGTTTERDAGLELEADPELLEEVDSESPEKAEDEPPVARTVHAGRHKLYIAGAVVAVVIAGIIGYFVGTGGFGPKGVAASVVAEDQLDTTVATWNLNGATNDVSVREAIESQMNLEEAKDENGMYPVPTADSILAYVRNEALLADAKAQGITVDDTELEATAQNSLGTSDFAQIAEAYRVTEDQAREIVREQTMIQKLYGTIVKDAPVAPVAPEEPAEGDEDKATAEYAAYIVELAGSEWDAESGSWKSEEGQMAAAFAGTEFDGKKATFEQANMAYSVAYQEFIAQSSAANEDWTAYVNKIFANIDLSLYGLYA